MMHGQMVKNPQAPEVPDVMDWLRGKKKPSQEMIIWRGPYLLRRGKKTVRDESEANSLPVIKKPKEDEEKNNLIENQNGHTNQTGYHGNGVRGLGGSRGSRGSRGNRGNRGFYNRGFYNHGFYNQGF